MKNKEKIVANIKVSEKDLDDYMKKFTIKSKKTLITGLACTCGLVTLAGLTAGHFAYKAAHPYIKDDGKIIVDPSIEDATIGELKTTPEGNKVATVTSKAKEISSIKVSINGTLLKEGEEYEYTVSNDVSNAVVLIYKKTLETHSGAILITPVYKQEATLVSISASFKTSKDYFLEDFINKSDIKVLANYSDKSSKEIADSYWSCTDFGEGKTYKFTEIGDHTFNIVYEGQSTTLIVNVKRPSPTGRLYVNFNSNGGTYVEHKEVFSGERVSEPTNVYKYKTEEKDTEYILQGWYDNPEFTGDAFDFDNTKITKDITLYAKWDTGLEFQMKDVFAPLYVAADHYQFHLPCKVIDEKYEISTSKTGCPIATISEDDKFLITVDGSIKTKDFNADTIVYASTVYKGRNYILDKMTIKNTLVDYVKEKGGYYTFVNSLLSGGKKISRDISSEMKLGKLPNNIVIPSMFKGEEIKLIEDFSLYQIETIRIPSVSNFNNIIISEGIETLFTRCFGCLTNLESIYIPSSITSKNGMEFSFGGCINLKDLYIDSLEIANMVTVNEKYLDLSGMFVYMPFEENFVKPNARRNIHLNSKIDFEQLIPESILKKNYVCKDRLKPNLLNEKYDCGKSVSKNEWLKIYEGYSNQFQTLAPNPLKQYKIDDLIFDFGELKINPLVCEYGEETPNIYHFDIRMEGMARRIAPSFGGGNFEFSLIGENVLVRYESEPGFNIWYQVLDNGNLSLEIISYFNPVEYYEYYEFNTNGYITKIRAKDTTDNVGDITITYPEI